MPLSNKPIQKENLMKKVFNKTLLSTLFVSSLFLGTNAMAADYKQNPFTLAYDGAITENVQGKVNTARLPIGTVIRKGNI